MTNDQSGIELSWYSKGYEDGKQEASKQWVGLSDDEILECLSKTKWNDVDYCPDHDDFASHIEQALKEKNNE